jgi:hypothetical protein
MRYLYMLIFLICSLMWYTHYKWNPSRPNVNLIRRPTIKLPSFRSCSLMYKFCFRKYSPQIAVRFIMFRLTLRLPSFRLMTLGWGWQIVGRSRRGRRVANGTPLLFIERWFHLPLTGYCVIYTQAANPPPPKFINSADDNCSICRNIGILQHSMRRITKSLCDACAMKIV